MTEAVVPGMPQQAEVPVTVVSGISQQAGAPVTATPGTTVSIGGTLYMITYVNVEVTTYEEVTEQIPVVHYEEVTVDEGAALPQAVHEDTETDGIAVNSDNPVSADGTTTYEDAVPADETTMREDAVSVDAPETIIDMQDIAGNPMNEDLTPDKSQHTADEQASEVNAAGNNEAPAAEDTSQTESAPQTGENESPESEEKREGDNTGTEAAAQECDVPKKYDSDSKE